MSKTMVVTMDVSVVCLREAERFSRFLNQGAVAQNTTTGAMDWTHREVDRKAAQNTPQHGDKQLWSAAC